MSVAARHRLGVEALHLDGSEQVLELGCGSGVATRLVLKELKTGQITALDRSAKMIAMVEEQSKAEMRAGRLMTRAEAFEAADFDGKFFNAILAINVDFNLRLGDRWAAVLQGLLAEKGRIVLAFEGPKGSTKGQTFSRLSRQRLEEAGFEATELVNEEGVVVMVAR